ncbi:argininosuccinate lyase [bacterium RCC_150]
MLQQSHANYRGYRTAGIRLNEELLGELEFRPTQYFDVTLDSIHAFDKAHVVMLIEQNLISRSDGRRILAQIRQMEALGVAETRRHARGGAHSCEQYLIQTLGEDIGGQVNLGRSSGDLGEVSRRITMREKIIDAANDLNNFREQMIELSERHIGVVFPAQSFLQHAQPTSLGHWFGMGATTLGRDFERLLSLYSRINQSPAGAGILTGSDFPVDRHRTSLLLGFDRTIPNTFDAIMSHDVIIEAASVIGIIWSNLARLADDLELWLSSDVRFIDVPDRFCDTSSVMAQKRNPNLPQQVKAQSVKAMGAVTMSFVAERGASGQPIMERFEAERLLWELFDDLTPVGKNLALMLQAMQPDVDRMRSAALDGWSTASDLTGLIVRKTELSWRTAHQITGIVVRLSDERGAGPRDVTPELINEAAELYFNRPLLVTAQEIAQTLDPVGSVKRRLVYGGPARVVQERAIEELRGELTSDVRRLNQHKYRLNESARLLEAAIDKILAPAVGDGRKLGDGDDTRNGSVFDHH